MCIHILQEIIDVLRKKKKYSDFCIKPRRVVSLAKLQKTAYGLKHVYCKDDGNEIISKMLSTGKPFMASRFGTAELSALEVFCKNKKNLIKFPYYVREDMGFNAGFFPINNYNLSRFAHELKLAAGQADVMAVFYNFFEEKACEMFCKNAELLTLRCINPIYWKNPYSRHFKGKKVLVIHPFEDSIREQYKKRELLFKNPDILPEFELITYKPVQGIADAKENLPYKDWFEALDKMKKDISQIDFDIAIIGAGAYGIFLAQYCKELGKQAIHIGGAAQLVFGIYGKRWEKGIYNSEGEKLINEHWVRPLESEKPKGFEKIEHGCYW